MEYTEFADIAEKCNSLANEPTTISELEDAYGKLVRGGMELAFTTLKHRNATESVSVMKIVQMVGNMVKLRIMDMKQRQEQ